MTESKEKVRSYLGNEPYIFVSYARKDWNKIAPFIAALQEHYNVWFDEGLHYAKEWQDEITDRIENCAAFIYFVTEKSLLSNNCKNEIRWAEKNDRPFLNILVEESTALTKDFEFSYGRYQMCKLFSFSSYQDAVADLAQKCEALEAAKKGDFPEKSAKITPDPIPQKQTVDDKNKSDSEVGKEKPRSARKSVPGAKLDFFLKILPHILFVCSGAALVLYFIFKNPALLFACLWTFFVVLPIPRTIRYSLKEKFRKSSVATIVMNTTFLTMVTIFPESIVLRWSFGICAGIRLIEAFFAWCNTDMYYGSKKLMFSTIESDSCSVIGLGKCSDPALTIPAKHGDNASVTSVAMNAFSNCTSLKSVCFKKGMKKIKKNAFFHCTGLTSVYFSDSITKIEEYAFAECASMTDIQFYGTVRRWKAIKKEPHWDDNTGDYTVHCYNGKVAKNNNQ